MIFKQFVIRHWIHRVPVRERVTFGLEMDSRGTLSRELVAGPLWFGGGEFKRESRRIGGIEHNERRFVEDRGRRRLLRGLRIVVWEAIGVDGNPPRTDISNPSTFDESRSGVSETACTAACFDSDIMCEKR